MHMCTHLFTCVFRESHHLPEEPPSGKTQENFQEFKSPFRWQVLGLSLTFYLSPILNLPIYAPFFVDSEDCMIQESLTKRDNFMCLGFSRPSLRSKLFFFFLKLSKSKSVYPIWPQP